MHAPLDRPASPRGHASIDCKYLTSDVATGIRGEEQDDALQLARPTDAMHRVRRREALLALSISPFVILVGKKPGATALTVTPWRPT